MSSPVEKVDCVRQKNRGGGGQEIWLTPLFGMSEPKPLKGWPRGKVRVRTRNEGYARGFVRAGNGTTRHFLVHDDGEHWVPCHEQGANITGKSLPHGAEADWGVLE